MALIKRVPPLNRPGPGIRQPQEDAAACEKARLRPLCKERRNAVTGEERTQAEAVILDSLFESPAFRRAETVCAYLPLPGELDLYPVWRRAAALGKTFALPCTDPAPGGNLTFRVLPGYDKSFLVPGPYHTLEPGEGCPLLHPRDMQGCLMLVPGLCFDDKGYRLGYGGGYYDRLLLSLFREGIYPQTMGLVFDACRAASLPHASHDIPVRYVLSERRLTVTYADYTRYRF